MVNKKKKINKNTNDIKRAKYENRATVCWGVRSIVHLENCRISHTEAKYFNFNVKCKSVTNMPQPVAGGYISLEGSCRPSNGQAIYQSTTEPTGPTSMLESMKRVLGQVVGSTTNAVSHDTDDLLNNTNGRQAIIISSR